jgi:hypothetical protein
MGYFIYRLKIKSILSRDRPECLFSRQLLNQHCPARPSSTKHEGAHYIISEAMAALWGSPASENLIIVHGVCSHKPWAAAV